MLGPFTFTFTLESDEFEKFGKVGCCAAHPDPEPLLNVQGWETGAADFFEIN